MTLDIIMENFGKMLDGEYDPVAEIVRMEEERGFKVVRPGDTTWFSVTDWKPASIASTGDKRARLVLLDAIQSNRGALTRTIKAIENAGLRPQIIDPTRELADTLRRRGWSCRLV